MTVIYDPACPPRIFDGLIHVFSTCRDCGELMAVIHPRETNHPNCTTVQTELESLGDLYISELNNDDDEGASLTLRMMADVEVLGLGSAAVQFARWGWPVFPLKPAGTRCVNDHQDRCEKYCVCPKAPFIPKKKGGNGFKDATNDVPRIDRWWSRHPDHNIGLATGHAFDVIDIDTKDRNSEPSSVGVMSFMNLLGRNCRNVHATKREQKHCATTRNRVHLPGVHAVAVTASGGMHLYVKPTGKGNFGGIWPGIDYRGLGGYVVAPPSLLGPPGRTYTWLVEPSPMIKGDRPRTRWPAREEGGKR